MCEFRPQLSDHALRVLLVDDNVDATESLRILLQLHGYRVLSCVHPCDALEAAPAFEPDVCILDIGLPSISGHDLARALRAAGLTRSTYIAVTGYGSNEARKASDAAGFAMHLTKPVDPAYLLARLACIEPARAATARKPLNDLAPTNG